MQNLEYADVIGMIMNSELVITQFIYLYLYILGVKYR